LAIHHLIVEQVNYLAISSAYGALTVLEVKLKFILGGSRNDRPRDRFERVADPSQSLAALAGAA
jgi:hypothetical protein